MDNDNDIMKKDNDEDIPFWRAKKDKKGNLVWETFPPYDIDDAITRLNPADKARIFTASIRLDQITDRTRLTEDENIMLDDVNDHIGTLREFFSEREGVIKKEIHKTAVTHSNDNEFTEIERTFKDKVKKTVQDFSSNIDGEQGLCQVSKDRKDVLNDFRHENKIIDREAEYTENWFFHIFILLLFITLESFGNAAFFANASGSGLVGGFGIAFGISFINVAFSFIFIGLLSLRYAHHRKVDHQITYQKIFGVLGTIIGLVTLAYLHLATAHYREILSQDPFADAHKVLGPLWENPLGLQDFNSLLLIILGGIISAVAIWEGYTINDTYPGFAKVYRNWQKADDHLTGAKKWYRDKIQDAYDTAIKDANSVNYNIISHKEKLFNLNIDIETFFFRVFDVYYSQAQDAARQLIRKYRLDVQSRRNDNDILPFHNGLINDLKKIDVRGNKDTIIANINQKISDYDQLIQEFPEKYKDFTNNLQAKLETYLVDSKIENIINDVLNKIKNKRENEKSKKTKESAK